jgi:hypothetical protein
LIKDYDLGINYHPGKANVVADALSRKKYCNATFARRMPSELRREIEYLNLGMVNETKVVMEVEPTLEAEIREGQLEDAKLKEIQQLIRDNKTCDFSEDSQGTLWLAKEYVFLTRSLSRSRFSEKLMTQPTLFTLAVPRCTRIWRPAIGGMVWSETLQNMYHYVTPAKG